MRSVFAALAVLCATGCATVPDLTPKTGIPVDATSVTYKDHTFTAGDHVRIRQTAGLFRPKDTGNVIDIRAETGRTGIVLGGMKRADPAATMEPIEILLIRFDAQMWHDTTSSQAEVELAPFEATIHADYMEALPSPSK
ncbi:MAG: hypothetical protein Q8R82_07220 [Hyphomonadaceae bacterium]|nr:hypothetical protein [Hyphomonadaceae bacterium]